VSGEHSTTRARMEQCFTLATTTFSSRVRFRKTTQHASAQPSLRRLSVRKHAL